MAHGTLNGNTYTKKEKESGKLRLAKGSWSINLDDLPPTAKIIRYVTETHTYIITTSKAHKLGFKRFLGGEPKLIVPINYWLRLENE